MPSAFAITASGTKISGKGELSFTVTNTSDRPIRGRADLLTPENAKPPYINLVGPAYRDFVANGTHQFTVKVEPPLGAPAGTHTARLRMVDDEHPEEVSVDGPPFTYDILPPEQKKRPLWIPIVAVVVVLAALSGIAAFIFWPRNPSVPVLTGLPLDQAQAAIEAQGLTLGDLQDQVSDKTPGTVIDQNPQPETKVAKGSQVDLIVALAPPPPAPVAVPDVTGKTQDEAKGLLQGAGLKVGPVKQSASYKFPPGRVASTSPSADAKVARDSEVTLVLAKEPDIHSTGEITLGQNASADLDQGTVVQDSSSDIKFEVTSPTQRSVVPLNDAKLVRVGTTPPGAAGCATATLGTTLVPVTQLQAGAHVCVLTKQGRLSAVRVVTAAGPSPASMRLAFTTYVPQRMFVVPGILSELAPIFKP